MSDNVLSILDVTVQIKFRLILDQYDEGLISTSEVLTRILCTMASPEQQTIAICDVVLRLRKQEEADAELLAKYDGCPNNYRPNS